MFLISSPTGYEFLIILFAIFSIPIALAIVLIRWLWYKGSNEKKRKQNQE